MPIDTMLATRLSSTWVPLSRQIGPLHMVTRDLPESRLARGLLPESRLARPGLLEMLLARGNLLESRLARLAKRNSSRIALTKHKSTRSLVNRSTNNQTACAGLPVRGRPGWPCAQADARAANGDGTCPFVHTPPYRVCEVGHA